MDDVKYEIGEIVLRLGRSASTFMIDGELVTVFDPPEPPNQLPPQSGGLRITGIDFEKKTVTFEKA